MGSALELEAVSKRYAGHTAVASLSLAVPRGSIFGLLGPNGAGKSTTLRMILNIIARDEGRISVLGADPARDHAVLRRIGYLPEERGLYKKMKVIDVIIFFARLKGVPASEAKRRADAWLERMGLAEWRDKRVEALSKGMQQKVQFIATVLHEPELLILDEPHSGLDPVNQEVLRDTILDARRAGRTVVLSTHNMEEAEQLCEHVCIIAGGRKVLDGVLRDVKRRNRGNRYAVVFDEPTREAQDFMERSRLFARVEAKRERWEVELAPGAEPGELIRALTALQTPLARFERVEPSLREIFVHHVGAGSPAALRPEPAHV